MGDVLEVYEALWLAHTIDMPDSGDVSFRKSVFSKMIRGLIGSSFDEEWYLSVNADVGEAVAAGHYLSGLNHYCQAGIYEGRLPFRPVFDEHQYLIDYPDVRKGISEGTFADATEHFAKRGFIEGRKITPIDPDYEPRSTVASR